jgi:hypothetical protein
MAVPGRGSPHEKQDFPYGKVGLSLLARKAMPAILLTNIVGTPKSTIPLSSQREDACHETGKGSSAIISSNVRLSDGEPPRQQWPGSSTQDGNVTRRLIEVKRQTRK